MFIVRSHVREKICNAVTEILSQNRRDLRALEDSDSFFNDLGFASLDVAQLIAVLEMDLGVDPFAEGASLSEVSTVGKLVALYEKQFAGLAV